jgi:hypothetical protein
MGQASAPLSPSTQQLNQSVSAVSDVNGKATFTFQNPPQGLTWTGTLTCGGAPNTAVFTANIGATDWGDWAGDSVYGPVQAQSMQQLVVTVVNLTPSTTYDLEWNGSSDPSALVQPVWPDSNISALVTVITNVEVTPTPGAPIAVIGVAGQPIDVVPYGGEQRIGGQCGANATIGIINPPPPGAYRLQRLIMTIVSGSGAGSVFLSGTISQWPYSISNTAQWAGGIFVDDFAGQIVPGEGLKLVNASGFVVNFSLTYDVIVLPVIS